MGEDALVIGVRVHREEESAKELFGGVGIQIFGRFVVVLEIWEEGWVYR